MHLCPDELGALAQLLENIRPIWLSICNFCGRIFQ